MMGFEAVLAAGSGVLAELTELAVVGALRAKAKSRGSARRSALHVAMLHVVHVHSPQLRAS